MSRTSTPSQQQDCGKGKATHLEPEASTTAIPATTTKTYSRIAHSQKRANSPKVHYVATPAKHGLQICHKASLGRGHSRAILREPRVVAPILIPDAACTRSSARVNPAPTLPKHAPHIPRTPLRTEQQPTATNTTRPCTKQPATHQTRHPNKPPTSTNKPLAHQQKKLQPLR